MSFAAAGSCFVMFLVCWSSLLVSQVTLESVDIIEIQTFVIGLPVGPAALVVEQKPHIS